MAQVALLLALVAAWKLRPSSPVRPPEGASSPPLAGGNAGKLASAVRGETRLAPAGLGHFMPPHRRTAKHGALPPGQLPKEPMTADATNAFLPTA
jgi:hypothetical protein